MKKMKFMHVDIKKYNQFGFGGELMVIKEPQLVEGVENVQQICVGGNHCIILDRNGAVFSTKFYSERFSPYYDHDGQNGTGSDNFSSENDNFHPIPFFKNIKIIGISVGIEHSLFVEENGVVWSCGRGQLGHSHRNNLRRQNPKQIESFIERNIKIKKCASGLFHNLLLDDHGNVYAFGCNLYGQCGIDKEKRTIEVPTMIEMHEKVENIQCAAVNSHIKSVSNIHFLFGDNTRDQFRLIKRTEKYINKPLAINEIVREMVIGEFIEIKKVTIIQYFTIINVLEIQ